MSGSDLLDHLVHEREQSGRDDKFHATGGVQVQHQYELARTLDRQVARSVSAQI